MKKTCITMMLLAIGSLLSPSCTSTAADPFDLALNQSIARIGAKIGTDKGVAQ